MNVNKINNSEIPYYVLETFGLTRNMIDDLPMDVLSKILSGQRSPVLPVEVEGVNGEKVYSKARFSLVYAEDGKLDVVFHPVFEPIGEKICMVTRDMATGKEQLKMMDTRAVYSDAVMEGLKAGRVVMDYITAGDGRKVKSFLQLDPETNEVLAVPTAVIGRNLQTLVGEFGLTVAETNCIQNGEILTIAQDEEQVSVGLDLNSATGLRFEKGDEKRWKEGGVRQWNKYSVGVFGCWMMENGDLSYIPEEEYTEEIWDEIEKQRNNRIKGQQIHKL
jgi:hypothetical protein